MTRDRDLQERVLEALEFESAVDAAEIAVTAHEGIVTLRGAVSTFFEKMRAERAALRVDGVRALANDIEVLADYQQKLTDSAIAARVATALEHDVAVPHDAVRATVRDGWVTLDGTVPWEYQRDAAEDALRHQYGIRGITNAILIATPIHAADRLPRVENEDKGIHLERALTP